MKLSVIVPTYNNPQQLTNMVNSMHRIGFFKAGDRELIIVNNGKQPIRESEHLKVVNCKENKGWEGGLVEGLKVAKGKYVCFQNDDVHIPQSDIYFYDSMMGFFTDDTGMIGPVTTTAAGIQSIYNDATPTKFTEVRWLIFFCVMMKRKTLDEVGGVDETLPGGDDFDLSIRMRLAGKKLYVNPHSFIIHHGFQTGTRVKGGPETKGGWNSLEMQEKTWKALIIKHGFRNWFETIQSQV